MGMYYPHIYDTRPRSAADPTSAPRWRKMSTLQNENPRFDRARFLEACGTAERMAGGAS